MITNKVMGLSLMLLTGPKKYNHGGQLLYILRNIIDEL